MSRSYDGSVESLVADLVGLLVVRHGRGRLRLFGELDAAEVRSVKASLLGADGDIELDCSGLSFIDAAALGLFVQLDAECRARSAKLLLINPSQCVLDLVELAGLDSLLTTEAGEPTR